MMNFSSIMRAKTCSLNHCSEYFGLWIFEVVLFSINRLIVHSDRKTCSNTFLTAVFGINLPILFSKLLIFFLFVQFIRFLRRTEGVEAARKYFLDARKSPNCTYHVYVAYAVMAFCLDKDPKVLIF